MTPFLVGNLRIHKQAKRH